ncbi:tyrosine-type recombinase/integrase [Raoultella sp. WB_B2P2-3]|uniref:tyrosine-type recombinase/integrase n=1 Tax=Raoultella scottii TaxID=3040937 RepID=UPI002F953A1C
MKNNKPLNKKELESIFLTSGAFNPKGLYLGAEFRKKALGLGFPPYILPTEINIILHYTPELSAQTFVSTLWNTGASLTEMIRLERKSFIFKSSRPYVKILSSETESLSLDNDNRLSPRRIVPLLSPYYIAQIKLLIATLKITGDIFGDSAKSRRIWDVDNFIATSWIDNAIKHARLDGVNFPVEVTPDAIKHSFAMNMLILGVEPSIVMKLMGFKRNKWLEIYLKVKCLIMSLDMDM